MGVVPVARGELAVGAVEPRARVGLAERAGLGVQIELAVRAGLAVAAPAQGQGLAAPVL